MLNKTYPGIYLRSQYLKPDRILGNLADGCEGDFATEKKIERNIEKQSRSSMAGLLCPVRLISFSSISCSLIIALLFSF
jgi:hypothetical protein